MESIWSKTVELSNFPILEGDAKTDVLIVGGGMAGVLCAHYLKTAGVDCLLVEENTLGSGTTGNTTAKITAQHGLIYYKLLKKFGLEKAKLYLQANLEAVEEYARLCENMDCDFIRQENCVYAADGADQLIQEFVALKQLGYGAVFRKDLPIPVKTYGGIFFPNQAQFHPLKFLSELFRGLPIYEHTKVLELAPHRARTSKGMIYANKIIVATHFPMLNKHGSFFLKLYQHRSYCIALENVPPFSGMYVDESKTGLSFRGYGDLLIIGGGGHRTGKQGGAWQELEEFAHRNYPGSRVRYRWAAQDCMSLDGVPYIGRYSNRAQGLYTATGFNKWGMTGSMVAARLLTDLVTGKPNPYENLFSPSRSILHPQLAINGGEAVLNLLTPTRRRCPHLGCALKWNPQEHSWDCPCHGSRFSEDGERLDGPATGNLRK